MLRDCFIYLILLKEGKSVEEIFDFVVLYVKQVLIELVWSRFPLIKPKSSTTCGLAKLFSFLIYQERYSHSKRLFLRLSSYEVTSGGNVTPLIAATNLDQAFFALIEIVEVISLQDLVAKLGERDAFTCVTFCHP